MGIKRTRYRRGVHEGRGKVKRLKSKNTENLGRRKTRKKARKKKKKSSSKASKKGKKENMMRKAKRSIKQKRRRETELIQRRPWKGDLFGVLNSADLNEDEVISDSMWRKNGFRDTVKAFER